MLVEVVIDCQRGHRTRVSAGMSIDQTRMLMAVAAVVETEAVELADQTRKRIVERAERAVVALDYRKVMILRTVLLKGEQVPVAEPQACFALVLRTKIHPMIRTVRQSPVPVEAAAVVVGLADPVVAESAQIPQTESFPYLSQRP